MASSFSPQIPIYEPGSRAAKTVQSAAIFSIVAFGATVLKVLMSGLRAL